MEAAGLCVCVCVCLSVCCDVALPGSYVSISRVMLSVLRAPKARHSHDCFLYCLANTQHTYTHTHTQSTSDINLNKMSIYLFRNPYNTDQKRKKERK